MRKLIMLLCCLISAHCRGQWIDNNYIDFEHNDSISKALYIDTVNYPRNQWQIGRPRKATFTSPWSPQNVLVTDTIHPYRANDTSVFYLKFPRNTIYMGKGFWVDAIEFRYKLEKDSFSVAKIEFSQDTGRSWFDLRDSVPRCITDRGGMPLDTLMPSSTWGIYGLRFYPEDYSIDLNAETYQLRFTFISGNDSTGHDGWMIDDISVIYGTEGVDNTYHPNLFSIYPNPSTGGFYLENNDQMNKGKLTITTMDGRVVCQKVVEKGTHYIDHQLPPGVYLVEVAANGAYCRKEFVVY